MINIQEFDEGSIFLKAEEDFDISKGKKADAIGTTKTFGSIEYIKGPNGWRKKTKGAAEKTDQHLKDNPGANHKDEELEEFARKTPEARLQEVISNSKDKRLQAFAEKELKRREDEGNSDKDKQVKVEKSEDIDIFNGGLRKHQSDIIIKLYGE